MFYEHVHNLKHLSIWIQRSKTISILFFFKKRYMYLSMGVCEYMCVWPWVCKYTHVGQYLCVCVYTREQFLCFKLKCGFYWDKGNGESKGKEGGGRERAREIQREKGEEEEQPKTISNVSPQIPPTSFFFFFLRPDLSLVWSLSSRAGWLPSDPQDSVYLHFPSTEITRPHYHFFICFSQVAEESHTCKANAPPSIIFAFSFLGKSSFKEAHTFCEQTQTSCELSAVNTGSREPHAVQDSEGLQEPRTSQQGSVHRGSMVREEVYRCLALILVMKGLWIRV